MPKLIYQPLHAPTGESDVGQPKGLTANPQRRKVLATMATGLLASPFVWGTARAADLAPVHRTAGAINLTDRVKGYTVDSIRNHSINTYWVVGASGTFAVDALWRIPEVKEALSNFRALSGRPVQDISGIAITHPHTDHYGGLNTLRDASDGALAIATAAIHRVIQNDEHGFYASRRQDMPDDIPVDIPVPEIGIENGVMFDVGGVPVMPALFRGNEAIETTVFYLPEDRVLITGDLVNNRTTPVFYQGGIDAWRHQLLSLRAFFPNAQAIAPGHGEPGDFDELVSAEVSYLDTWQALIQEALDREGGEIGEQGVRTIRNGIVDAFPDWRTSAGVPDRDQLIALNIDWTLRGWRIAGASEGNPQQFRPQAD